MQHVVSQGLNFRLVDAKGQVLGRLAAQLSHILQGKDKPTYSPHKDEGDVVVCINARDVVLTRDKLDGKQYVKHTGYPGGQKWETARNMLARSPEELMKKAVGRMLPKNKLRLGRLRKLRIYPGAEHPFAAQHLTRLQPEKPRELRPRRNAAEMTTRPGDEQEIF